jgi:hypothetical protein
MAKKKPEPKRKPRPRARATKAELCRRIFEVYKLRLGGAEFPDLREWARSPERGWVVSDGQLWRYIRAADRLCKRHFDGKADHLTARHVLQRRQLYAHAMNGSDYATALRVLQDEAKLLGLYPAKGLELTGKNGAPLYPPLEAMVAALIEAERGGASDADGQRSEPGDRPAVAGSEKLP